MQELALCFLAGCLATLSPCVLPVLPLIVGSAFQEHRFGPLAVAAGMTVTFTILGVSFAAAGQLLGLDQSSLRPVAAIVLILLGAIFISSRLQAASAKLLAPIAGRAEKGLQSVQGPGLWGQFLVGALLGIVWSPCSGPALGAAVTLASKEGGLAPAAARMFAFGLGSASPVVLIAYSSRQAFVKMRGKLLEYAAKTRLVFGWILVAVGVTIFLKLDKFLESQALEIMPEWLIDLTTRY